MQRYVIRDLGSGCVAGLLPRHDSALRDRAASCVFSGSHERADKWQGGHWSRGFDEDQAPSDCNSMGTEVGRRRSVEGPGAPITFPFARAKWQRRITGVERLGFDPGAYPSVRR